MVKPTGTGDVERSIRLMWRASLPKQRTRGPKPALSADAIVAAAIELADAAGLDGLSMRSLADALGVGTMSLYNHVPSKAELLDVMTDQVFGQLYPSGEIEGATWRERLGSVARANWELCLSHPWLVELATVRPPLGPGTSRKYELELGVLEAVGFCDLDMDSAIGLVTGHAFASARIALDAQRVAEQTSMPDAEWWAVAAPILEQVMPAEDYPISGRVGQAAGQAHQAAVGPHHAFEFGLERILDGLGDLLKRRRAASRDTPNVRQ